MEHELRLLYRKEGLFEERRELKKKIDELKKEVETTKSYYVSLKYEFMKTQVKQQLFSSTNFKIS